MKFLKIVGIAVGVLGALFLLVAAFLPSEYNVERSITINTPPSVAFGFVNDLSKNELWSPWKEQDPSLESTLGSITVGKGASVSWTSNEGNGKMVVSESVAPTKITTDLDFGSHGTATGRWAFEAAGDGVEVTWGLHGEASYPVGRYFGLMMESMAGTNYESGLAKLKTVAEAELARQKAEALANAAAEAPAAE